MWETIVERAVTEKVDVVALSGDVVDHDNRFFEAAGSLERGILRLADKDIDTVVDLAGTLGRDPRAIINALEDGRARGFQTKKRYELAEYLDAEGYLDERNKLTPEQILDQVRPAAFDDLDRGFIDVSRMEELVRFVTRIDETRDGGIAVRNRAGVDQ